MPVAFKYYVYCTFSEWSTYCLLCERRIICAREPRIYLLARSQAHRMQPRPECSQHSSTLLFYAESYIAAAIAFPAPLEEAAFKRQNAKYSLAWLQRRFDYT